MQKSRREPGSKLVAATLDGRKTITLRFDQPIQPFSARRLAVQDETGAKVAIAEVVPVRPTVDGRARTFAVRLKQELDFANRLFQVAFRGLAPYPVSLGRILRGRRFFDPETPLGAAYAPEETAFAVFSPMAEAVDVVISKTPTGGSHNARFPLVRNERAVWSVTVPGDLKDRFYSYRLSGPGLNPKEEVTDVYATCAQRSGARAMIADLDGTNPDRFRPPQYVQLAAPTDAIVYEMHVRDFTIAPNSGVRHKGLFLGLAEAGTQLNGDASVKTGLDHLVELGVTHVQLMPVQSFEDPTCNDPPYNWGYMPVFFNSPEVWYATTPEGDARIREFKQAVHAFHERGIGVILDVVYNHTSRHGTFDRTAPAYYYRTKPDGAYWDGSGCGNEFCTENPMARRFVLDSLSYWVTEFGIDGFRFDLMGLIDFKTLETVRDELRKVNPSVMLYGEPWAAAASGLRRVSDKNAIRGSGIGAYNDHFRDAIKGDCNGGAPGFIQAGDRSDGVRKGIAGAIHDWAEHPTDVITYCACHDNLTTWDKIVQSAPDAPDDVRKRMQRLAGLILLTSQGTAFLHAGQEMCRTKGGNHNSYNAPDDVNRIDWSLKKANRDVFDYYKGLIEIRRGHPVFRLRTRDDVERRLHFLDNVPNHRCLAFTLDGRGLPGESWSTVLVLLNGDSHAQTFALPPGRWLTVGDADRVSPLALAEPTGSLEVPPHSGTLLHK